MHKLNLFKAYFSKISALDLRSLSLFRILLGLFILCDIWIRCDDLALFYTNRGFLPIESIKNWSIHSWYGSVEWIQFLFGITALLAIFLILGIRVRWVMFCLFIMTISLHLRNNSVNNAGDTLLRFILLIGIFLPLNGYFSITKTRAITAYSERNHLASSPWTFLYLIQIVLMYSISGFLKNDGIWNPPGMAIHYIMHIHTYIKESAFFIRQFSGLMTAISYMTVFLERFLWLLIFIPYRISFFRKLTIISFVFFHFSLFMFMELGMFPWLGILIWIPFIPSSLWNKILHKLSISLQEKTVLQNKKKWIYYSSSALAAFVLLIIVHANLVSLKFLPNTTVPFKMAKKLKMTQSWNLFTGNMTSDGWLIIEAVLIDGSHIDLEKSIETNWKKPRVYSKNFSNHRQRKFHKNIRKNYKSFGVAYMAMLADKWNNTHAEEDKKITSVTMYYMKEKIKKRGGYYAPQKIVINQITSN